MVKTDASTKKVVSAARLSGCQGAILGIWTRFLAIQFLSAGLRIILHDMPAIFEGSPESKIYAQPDHRILISAAMNRASRRELNV